MMSSVLADLKTWGVPEDRIFSEAFGPASGKAIGSVKSEVAQPAAATACQVTFVRSNCSIQWDGTFANLLECAEKNNIKIDSGCRAGSCGTCLVAIKSGKVASLTGSEAETEEGACLTCVSVPKGDLVLEI
jgi:uncharacterized protein